MGTDASGRKSGPARANARARRKSRAAARPAAVRLWIRLTLPGVGQIGPGKIELLRQIRERRSISAAAREMNMSYRRAWLLVADLNAAFREPVVAKWMGGSARGGAKLTQTGEKLLKSYDAVVARAGRANRALLDELAGIVVVR